MGDKSNIEWTDASWTPIRARNLETGAVGWHCTHVTPGCVNCYSETLNKRLGTGLEFKPANAKKIEIFLDEKMLMAPLRWKRGRKIFVCSMTDAFADFVTDDMLDRMFAVMALTPHHTFQVLTKRSVRMRGYCSQPEMARRIWRAADMIACDFYLKECHPSAAYLNAGSAAAPWPLPNVWAGVSTEDQPRANERIPDLLLTPAAKRYVSAEPLLGPIDYTRIELGESDATFFGSPEITRAVFSINALTGARYTGIPGLDLIITGYESGPRSRACDVEWIRSIKNQCVNAGVAFFYKQAATPKGRKIPTPELDGKSWTELPQNTN